MLRVTVGSNAQAAKRYFVIALERGDGGYHLRDNGEPTGLWGGKAAERLGLAGEVTYEKYASLIDNRHPDTGETLTVRRLVQKAPRSYYDFTFSGPKSVSIAEGLGQRGDVRAAFEEAVASTMQDIEARAQTRVRAGGANEDRTTGNLVYATFVHRTTRPIDGVPDPHLHAHVIVFNATFDGVENRFKAFQAGGLKSDAPYFEALFHSRLAGALTKRGYSIEERSDGRWELAGIAPETIDRFSRRTQLIEAEAERRGVVDPEQKAELGAITRERKGRPVPYESLRETWRGWLSDAERQSLDGLGREKQAESHGIEQAEARSAPNDNPTLESCRPPDGPEETIRRTRPPRDEPVLDAPELDGYLDALLQHAEQIECATPAPESSTPSSEGPDRSVSEPDEPTVQLSKLQRAVIDQAINGLLERQSVVSFKQATIESLTLAPGQLTPTHVRTRIGERTDLVPRDTDGQLRFTSQAALNEEREIVRTAARGRGQCGQLGRPEHRFQDAELNEQQRTVVRHVLTSNDRVMLLHGRAGTGKTRVLRELDHAIQSKTHVYFFAPTAEASRGVLKAEGFKSADTVAKLLSDDRHTARRTAAVWVVDEAGLLDNKQMIGLLRLAERHDARVLLVGDVRQHRSVSRTDALRVLMEYAGLKPAGLREVVRQRGRYKEVAETLADGNATRAVEMLDKLGWLHVGDATPGREALATRYAELVRRGRSVLAVAPTHDERRAVSEAIREKLSAAGKLGRSCRVERLERIDTTAADRMRADTYEKGMVLQFGRSVRGLPFKNWGGFRAGERVEVLGRDPFGNVLVSGGGQLRALPLKYADRFEVYRKTEMEVAVGDTIRVTRNGQMKGFGRLVNNGSLLKVTGFTPLGDIRVGRFRIIPKSFAHIDHGYCMTSHAAQAKTVDEVLVSMPKSSLAAASAEQFYVSITRGRERAAVYTDDKAALLSKVQRSSERESAIELTKDEPLKRGPTVVERSFARATEMAEEAARRVREAARRRDGPDMEHAR